MTQTIVGSLFPWVGDKGRGVVSFDVLLGWVYLVHSHSGGIANSPPQGVLVGSLLWSQAPGEGSRARIWP